MRSLYILSLCALLFAACGDGEDPIIPHDGGEKFYSLPQGNNDFDQTLVEWFKDYGFYPLYKFTDRDVYWNYSNWMDAIYYGTSSLGENIIARPGDPKYVGKQVELVKKSFVDIYPKELLQKMTLKLMLCSGLYIPDVKSSWSPSGTITTFDSVAVNSRMGYDFIAVNYGSPMIETLSNGEKVEFQRELNLLFITRAINRNAFTMPEGFGDVIPAGYYTYTNYYTGQNLFDRGFLTDITVASGVDAETNKRNDFLNYVKLASYPLSVLEGAPDRSHDNSGTPYWNGALNPERDTNGYVKKKYDIVIAYLKSLGVDIGQLQIPEF